MTFTADVCDGEKGVRVWRVLLKDGKMSGIASHSDNGHLLAYPTLLKYQTPK